MSDIPIVPLGVLNSGEFVKKIKQAPRPSVIEQRPKQKKIMNPEEYEQIPEEQEEIPDEENNYPIPEPVTPQKNDAYEKLESKLRDADKKIEMLEDMIRKLQNPPTPSAVTPPASIPPRPQSRAQVKPRPQSQPRQLSMSQSFDVEAFNRELEAAKANQQQQSIPTPETPLQPRKPRTSAPLGSLFKTK